LRHEWQNWILRTEIEKQIDVGHEDGKEKEVINFPRKKTKIQQVPLPEMLLHSLALEGTQMMRDARRQTGPLPRVCAKEPTRTDSGGSRKFLRYSLSL
jgi:hypothetical protein